MKVKVLFTGGTIGSRAGSDGKIATRDNPYILLEKYREVYGGEEICFEAEEPYQILSENLRGEYLEQLIRALAKTVREDVDGVVITHGTDTLQYSAAILGYLFADSKLPIVLVSSDFVLEDERTNGLLNFYHAIEFIRRKESGVYVSYQNKGDLARIHRAVRLQPPKILSADVESLGGCYGVYEDAYRPMMQPQKLTSLLSYTEKKAEEMHLEDGVVLRIVPYVGMEYPEIPEKVRAVLHESYHSGTIAVQHAFQRFAKEAKKRNIPVYLTGLKSGEKEYETVEEYRRANVTPLREGAAIAQYCKLWLAISNDMDVERVMSEEIAGDFLS